MVVKERGARIGEITGQAAGELGTFRTRGNRAIFQ